MSAGDSRYSAVSFASHGFFWVTFRGELSLGRLTRAHQEFTSHPDYFVGVDELLDFSDTTIEHLSSPDIARIRDYALRQTDARPGKNVIVVSTKLEYGLGRMIAGGMGQDVPEQRQICFSLHDALEWLRPGQADALLEAHRQKASD